jgi:hypothetical protein
MRRDGAFVIAAMPENCNATENCACFQLWFVAAKAPSNTVRIFMISKRPYLAMHGASPGRSSDRSCGWVVCAILANLTEFASLSEQRQSRSPE